MPSQNAEREGLLSRIHIEASRFNLPEDQRYPAVNRLADLILRQPFLSPGQVETLIQRTLEQEAGVSPVKPQTTHLPTNPNDAARALARADGLDLDSLPPKTRIDYFNRASQKMPSARSATSPGVTDADIEHYYGRPIEAVSMTQVWEAKQNIQQGRLKR